jgi:hypothetical protein
MRRKRLGGSSRRRENQAVGVGVGPVAQYTPPGTVLSICFDKFELCVTGLVSLLLPDPNNRSRHHRVRLGGNVWPGWTAIDSTPYRISCGVVATMLDGTTKSARARHGLPGAQHRGPTECSAKISESKFLNGRLDSSLNPPKSRHHQSSASSLHA